MTGTSSILFRGKAPKKIAVALSGGVDSSVVAYLMKKACYPQQEKSLHTQNNIENSNLQHPHELVAVHMSNWNTSDEEDPYCTRERDWKDAQAVASQLDIPLHPTSFAAEYWTQVFEPFTESVEQGSRPNPDVQCNRFIKFGALKDYVQNKLQADVLATGHYARLWDRSGSIGEYDPYQDLVEEMLEHDPDRPTWISTWGSKNSSNNLTPLLLAARDRSKCQSFFLSSVPGTAFQGVLFPLGDFLKKKQHVKQKQTNNSAPNNVTLSAMTVREIAEQAHLPTARKKDSMGICFIGKRPGGFTDFIDQYFPTEDTNSYQFVDVDTGGIVANEFGNSTTNHMVYTGGQRAKISGATAPWFVVKTDKASTNIWVCQGTHHPALYTDTLYVKDLHWIAGDLPSPLEQNLAVDSISSSSLAQTKLPILRAKCRVRNLQPLVDCEITYHSDARHYKIRTKKPLRAITPGQHCALYVGSDGLVCLGGGTIWEPGPTYHELGRDMPPKSNLHPAGHNDLSVLEK